MKCEDSWEVLSDWIIRQVWSYQKSQTKDNTIGICSSLLSTKY